MILGIHTTGQKNGCDAKDFMSKVLRFYVKEVFCYVQE